MALKAGRVGVALDQVDEFGQIKSEVTSGYTKQEADAKFETQTHAASTYETKSDAAALQSIQLSAPVELLNGSALTVESALQGLSDDVVDNLKVETGAVTIVPESATDQGNTLKKIGRLVFLNVRIGNVSCDADGVIATIPVGYRPIQVINAPLYDFTSQGTYRGYIADGALKCDHILSASEVRFCLTYVI